MVNHLAATVLFPSFRRMSAPKESLFDRLLGLILVAHICSNSHLRVGCILLWSRRSQGPATGNPLASLTARSAQDIIAPAISSLPNDTLDQPEIAQQLNERLQ